MHAAPASLSVFAKGLVGLAVGMGIGFASFGPPAQADRITSDHRLVTIGGTIRKRDGHWLVWDPNHAHRGFGKVTCLKSGGLTVELRPVGFADRFGAVTVDGVLASKGVAVGSSANARLLTLTLARNGDRIGCGNDVFDDPGTNIWITWTQVVSND
ncbi:MAG: hypothetical protein U0667_13385 [Chloroflexota bacterium]